MINPVSPALLRWHGQQCRSANFDDIYFSADGPNEVARVFHTPVALGERFAATQDSFTCAELGFGSGLSFAATAELFWHHNRGRDHTRLHYISIEAAPFSAADRARICEQFGAQLPVLLEFDEAAPALLGGWHRVLLRDGRICLSLYHGPVDEAIRDLDARQQRGVDHWLLDGFSPSHNPDMWRGELLEQVADLSAPNGSVATFTAAGQVLSLIHI